MVDAGLKLDKFPHPTSKLSTRCKYGVITSQLHRYNVACTQLRDFVQIATELYATYLKNRYRSVQVCTPRISTIVTTDAK